MIPLPKTRNPKPATRNPMLLGIDFDNTLVCYDRLFYDLAREHALIPPHVAADKTAVRDFLRAADREDDWTWLQGLAYGPRITGAHPYPGALESLRHWRSRGHSLAIVSHKTLHPYAGEPHDLHAAARGWLETHLDPGLLSGAHFELTRQAKLQRAAALNLDVFIDDLPDILRDLAALDSGIRLYLFDPHGRHPEHPCYERISQWTQLQNQVEI